ncbi:putative glycoside hydrolase family 15 protein [Allokutzneria sp. A3M-2-11 16]|uniref:putative glycoside hydrolase n=1 Tax=Allokutzneria sp. A3M-2-11 16 TaxID=2962043 RepID=UPI0020B65E5F|nr:putative glycoside hydrolase [Allokutzneria sp. A3M-2-11 16]MCP3798441.1 putative glycoside hydrolase family 15 protein [Allokutzneria sp. A3M-2-11 16]
MKAIPALLVVFLLATATAVPGFATEDSPTRTRSFWIHWNSTPVTDDMLAAEAKKRDYVLLNAWEASFVPKLKAANPAITVLVYKDMSSTRSYACRDGRDESVLPAGIGFCYADRQRPDWFLKGPDGQRLEYSGYPGHWQMDIGDPKYQQEWAENVVAATKGVFDGVLIDNALWSCDAYHPGTCPAKYRDNAAFQSAYASFLANTRSTFTAAGLKTVANMTNARLHEGGWNAYMANLDGGWDEWWLSFSDTEQLPDYAEGWRRQVQQIADNEAAGKITLVQPHFSKTAERPFRYALASYYMAASTTKSAIAEIEKMDGYGDPSPWHTEYDWNLGAPSGPYSSVGTNVYRRDFACGTVVVNANPTASGPVTLPLGGDYIDELGAQVSSVSLPGTSGSILRKPCPEAARPR